MSIHVSTLRCGMTLLVEPNPAVRSLSLSWLLPGGFAEDPSARMGRAAMWAEMLMRGTQALDSRSHADAVDRLGASRNVDNGSYFLRLSSILLGERLHATLPLLTDMVLRPRFDQNAVEPARDLALQAIAALADDPQQRAVLAARERHYRSPLNRSGLGTESGLTSITHDELAKGWIEAQSPARSIFCAAGAVDPAELAQQLDELLGDWSGTSPEPVVDGVPVRGYGHEIDATNQMQIVLVYDAPTESSSDSLLEKIVVNVLSGGMSGRLFTEVREKRGLCYSVSAGYRGDRDTGGVVAYVGSKPERAQESLDVLIAELRKILTKEGAVTADEFERARTGMKSRLVFAGESSAARAAAIGSDYFRLGRCRTLAELSREVDAVTLEQVNEYLSRRQLGPMTIQTVGPAPLQPQF
ncbi:MAG: insulinase family protein [Phycisphaeraceae bacterium]|nr:insulinase family protein [Phycisphaeraceae bacterium]